MSDDLKDELQSIDGVGEATAEKILDVVNGYQFDYQPLVEKAFEAAADGDDRQAAIYLRRADH